MALAYKRPVINVSIPADLVEEVRCLPLPEQLQSDTRKVLYVLQAGINSLAYMAQKNRKKVG